MPFNILPTYTCNIWAKDVHYDVMTNIHIDHIGSYRYMIMIRTYSYVYLNTYGLHVDRLIRYILLAHIGPLFTFSLGDTKQKNICCLICFQVQIACCASCREPFHNHTWLYQTPVEAFGAITT